MDPEVLAQVLQPLQQLQSTHSLPNLLVGLGSVDDAAVYKLNDEMAIISTTDFFTPVVDNPYDYGAIAAANSMSDVYAMGGEVLFALNIAGFPGWLDTAIIGEILRGGTEKAIEAGAAIAGGHTIQDEEPKYGLAVTGLVHPQRIFTKSGAKAGDALVLTKPLGTGTISTAVKRGVARPEHVSEMTDSMKRLNRRAAKAAQEAGGVKAVTDITGFGLLGHGMEMAKASGVQFVLSYSQIPFLNGAAVYGAQFIFPGGTSNNKLYYDKLVTFDPDLSEMQQMLVWDAQTSGGLLIAVPQDSLKAFQAACAAYKQPNWVIGYVQEGAGIVVEK